MSNQNAATRPTVLAFVAYYLPGHRFGGPVRSIANMVEHLGDEFLFRIVTSDRDFLSQVPYAGVKVDDWNTVGKAQVFYASPSGQKLPALARLLRETRYDVLYLNSFFGPIFTLRPLLARRLGLAPLPPCVIAPRGEFSAGALKLKAWKKRPYIALIRGLSLYSGLTWQASSEYESAEISLVMRRQARHIVVAPNLWVPLKGVQASTVDGGRRNKGVLRVIFLSRITPKKNLDFALRVLSRVNIPVEFNIYGPVCAGNYWRYCQRLTEKLPEHIHVTHHGEVAAEAVPDVFARHDLFLFPTRGENYGHVVLEALSVGTPVLVSEHTPWQADSEGGCTIRNLSDPEGFVEVITRFGGMDSEAMHAARIAAQGRAQRISEDSGIIETNRRLFLNCLGEGNQED